MFTLPIKNQARRVIYRLEVTPLTPMRLRAKGRTYIPRMPRVWAQQVYRIPTMLPGDPKQPPKADVIFARVNVWIPKPVTAAAPPPPPDFWAEPCPPGYWRWRLAWTPPCRDDLISGYRVTFHGNRASSVFVPKVNFSPVIYFMGPPKPSVKEKPVEIVPFSGGRLVPCPKIAASLTVMESES